MKWTLGLLFVASMASAMPKRDAKAFSLFSVVTFPNEECQTTMAMSGICITAEECTTTGGQAQGNCASGFGVCCFRSVFATAATTTVAVDNDLTHIQNEDFPMTVGNGATTAAATYMFQIRGDASICQIRLDFILAMFSPPTNAVTGNTDGMCGDGANGDDLTVELPLGRTPFQSLCGTLTGQHIYLDTSMANPGATVIIRTGTNMFPRSWKILVRRLRCDDFENLPPPGCAQFHTGLGGRITSLNGGINGQVLLRNLNYDVCIRPAATSRGLVIQSAPEQAGAGFTPFQLQTAEGAVGTVSATGNTANVAQCTVEGIVIENSFFAGIGNGAVLPPRFCGAFLNPTAGNTAAGAVVALDIFGPNTFRIGVRSDNSESSADTGFDLIYQQV